MDNGQWLQIAAGSILDTDSFPSTVQASCEDELTKIAVRTGAGAFLGKLLRGGVGTRHRAGVARTVGAAIKDIPFVGEKASVGFRAGMKHGDEADAVLARGARIAKGRAATTQVKTMAKDRGISIPERPFAPGAVGTPGKNPAGGTVADWWKRRTPDEKTGLKVGGGALAGAAAYGAAKDDAPTVNHY